MTQPPLSRQIQMLERDLGVALFDRAGRSVRITPAGRAFLIDARRILSQAERATLAVRRVPSGEAGRLHIGFTAASTYRVLGSIVNTARTQLPHVELVLHEMVTS